jgi:hypothetical protein
MLTFYTDHFIPVTTKYGLNITEEDTLKLLKG